MIRRPVTVNCVDGLDARPIALLVQEASQYESRVFIEILDQQEDQREKYYGHDDPEISGVKRLRWWRTGSMNKRQQVGLRST